MMARSAALIEIFFCWDHRNPRCSARDSERGVKAQFAWRLSLQAARSPSSSMPIGERSHTAFSKVWNFIIRETIKIHGSNKFVKWDFWFTSDVSIVQLRFFWKWSGFGLRLQTSDSKLLCLIIRNLNGLISWKSVWFLNKFDLDAS